MSLDQKFYCILSFVTKDDLGIKDDFDRKQLSTKIPTPLIQDKIKSIFNLKDYPKRSFKSIYLDRLGVYLDIIYENDNYLEAAKEMPTVGETIKTKDGMAVVLDVNVLENIIRAKIETKDKRNIVEVKTYSKEEVKRMGKRKCCCKSKEDDLPEEVKALLEE